MKVFLPLNLCAMMIKLCHDNQDSLIPSGIMFYLFFHSPPNRILCKLWVRQVRQWGRTAIKERKNTEPPWYEYISLGKGWSGGWGSQGGIRRWWTGGGCHAASISGRCVLCDSMLSVLKDPQVFPTSSLPYPWVCPGKHTHTPTCRCQSQNMSGMMTRRGVCCL